METSGVQSEQTSNRVVAVLGMHSGGTSAVTRGLDCLGVNLGNQLLPGGERQNPRGFFEDEPLLEISDQVLMALGIRWESTRLITADEWANPEIARLRLAAVESIETRFASVPILGFKNPRSARLLPFWQSVFSLVDRSDSYVIALRNPVSVAHSLHERNGFSKRRAYLLWLIHQVQSVARTKGKTRICVDFDLLLDNPDMQLRRIATALDLAAPTNASLEEYASQFLSQDLRHSQFDDEDVQIEQELSALGKRAHEILHRWATDDPDASAKIDAAMRQIERRLSELAPALSELDELESQVHQERYAHARSAGEWREERSAFVETAESQSEKELSLKGEIARAVRTLEVSNAGLHAQQNSLASAEERASTLEGTLAKLERGRKASEKRTAYLDREQNRLVDVVEGLKTRLQEQTNDAAARDQQIKIDRRKDGEQLQESLDQLARAESHSAQIIAELDEIRALRNSDVQRLVSQIEVESERARSSEERSHKLAAELDRERQHFNRELTGRHELDRQASEGRTLELERQIESHADSHDAHLRNNLSWIVDRVSASAGSIRGHAEATSRTRTWRVARRLQRLSDRLRWRRHHDGLEHITTLAQILQTRSNAATADIRDLASQADQLSRAVREVSRGEIFSVLQTTAQTARRLVGLPVASGPADRLFHETIEISHFLAQLKQSPLVRLVSSGGPAPELPGLADPTPTVDVIVPVYGAFDETQRCLESLFRAKNFIRREIIVVDDGNHDSKLLALLAGYAERDQIILVRIDENLGYPNAVNQGMALHPERDVVLLNSDTRVADHWIDRLRRAAASDWKIATATPFSNDGQICSWPLQDASSATPTDEELVRLNTLVAEENHGRTLTIPTAIGFCMYITREALRDVGPFDVATFGRGYGEESDFSMRARTMGYRNVLAADVYVAHEGSRSFGAEREERTEHAARAISLRHPTYAADVERFIRTDPARPLRRLIEARVSIEPDRPQILMISHDRGGGTQHHIEGLRKSLEAEGVGCLFLRPDAEGRLHLSSQIGVSTFSQDMVFNLNLESELASLTDTLRVMNVRHIHVHHILDHPFIVTTLPDLLGIGFDVTLHDYFGICPRVHLIDESNRYCGEPDDEGCNQCIERLGSELGSVIDITQWRDRNHAWLASARRVFVPSADTAGRFSRRFPKLELRVRPHPNAPSQTRAPRRARSANKTRRVAIVGAISASKGSEILLSTIHFADQNNLPIEFKIIGYTDRDDELASLRNVSVSGPYRHEDLGGLLEKSDCALAFFPTAIPETYSYTLSETVSAGLFPVAFEIGALAERIQAIGWGHLLPVGLDPSEINEALLNANVPEPPSEIGGGAHYESILLDYYEISELTETTSSD